jgi:hypothetical protein
MSRITINHSLQRKLHLHAPFAIARYNLPFVKLLHLGLRTLDLLLDVTVTLSAQHETGHVPYA